MAIKLLFVSIFHALCLGLLFVPDEYQGPVVLTVSGLNLRVLDAASIIMIILATSFLFIYILRNSLPQIKQLQELSKQDKGNSERIGNARKK